MEESADYYWWNQIQRLSWMPGFSVMNRYMDMECVSCFDRHQKSNLFTRLMILLMLTTILRQTVSLLSCHTCSLWILSPHTCIYKVNIWIAVLYFLLPSVSLISGFCSITWHTKVICMVGVALWLRSLPVGSLWAQVQLMHASSSALPEKVWSQPADGYWFPRIK